MRCLFLLGALAAAVAVHAANVENGFGTGNSVKGYIFNSDVVQHSKIDKDVEEISNAMNDEKYSDAENVFTNGKNSDKVDDNGAPKGKRKLADFSKDLDQALQSMPGGSPFNLYNMYKNYHGNAEYAKDFVLDAMKQQGQFSTVTDKVGRKELAVKGTQLQLVFMYTIYELEQARVYCTSDMSKALHSWDEGWAFYVGSKLQTNVAAAEGQLGYTLASKRAVADNGASGQFLTTDASSDQTGTRVWVNKKLQTLFQTGKGMLATAACTEVESVIKDIVAQMNVPLLQGVLRYAQNSKRSGVKGRAEGYAFAMAIVPQLHQCHNSIGEGVKTAMGIDESSVDIDNVRGWIIEGLKCLGLTCADIWNFKDLTNVVYKDKVRMQCGPAILGYTPGNLDKSVYQHSRIDLDIRDMENTFGTTSANFQVAKSIFENGQNSHKTSQTRKLAAFSNAAYTDMPLYKVHTEYWGDGLFARNFVLNALDNKAPFNKIPRNTEDGIRALKELVIKGSQLQSVWMYVLREMFEAVESCKNSDIPTALHSWDEGWVFYAGSLQVMEKSGKLGYALALKRAPQFKNRKGEVNDRMLALFESGKSAISQSQCTLAADILQQVERVMTIPVVQGLIRYIYKVRQTGKTSLKEKAECWAFLASVLPRISQCNKAVGDKLRDEFFAFTSNPSIEHTYDVDEMVSMVQSTFPCLGIECDDVGNYVEGTSERTKQCYDWKIRNNQFGGYQGSTDVTQHSRIDLDVEEFETHLKASDYTAAKQIYSNGKYSEKTSSMRTLEGLTKDQNKDMLFNVYKRYWKSKGRGDRYAHDFITDAIDAKGEFTGAPAVARKEGAVKGAQYQAVWMYVFHELEDSITNCKQADLLANDDKNVHAWDEGAAFFAGSRVGTLGLPKKGGKLVYTLMEKRAGDFGDSDSSHIARTIALFQTGLSYIVAGHCDKAEAIMHQLQAALTIPLIQGLFRYLYRADPNSDYHKSKPEDQPKSKAEGWAFAAAVLPQLHACNSQVAEQVYQNMRYSADPIVKDGYKSVVENVQSLFPCLNINGSHVGAYSESGKVIIPRVEGAELPGSNDASCSNGWKVTGILFIILFILLVGFVSIRFYCRRNQKMHDIDLTSQTPNSPSVRHASVDRYASASGIQLGMVDDKALNV